MKKLLFMSLLTVAFFAMEAGSAQQAAGSGEAVWSLEFVKVKPGMFEQTITYLDAWWIPSHQEAKRQGAIVAYRRIAEEPQAKGEWDIILMTEYRNQAAYDEREKGFASLDRQMMANNRGKIMALDKKDLYDIVDTRILRDYSEGENPHLKLIGKQ